MPGARAGTGRREAIDDGVVRAVARIARAAAGPVGHVVAVQAAGRLLGSLPGAGHGGHRVHRCRPSRESISRRSPPDRGRRRSRARRRAVEEAGGRSSRTTRTAHASRIETGKSGISRQKRAGPREANRPSLSFGLAFASNSEFSILNSELFDRFRRFVCRDSQRPKEAAIVGRDLEGASRLHDTRRRRHFRQRRRL